MIEITNGKLFSLFTGQNDIDKILRNGDEFFSCACRLNLDTEKMEDYRYSVNKSDLECVNDVFSSNLRSLSTTEYLLLILWIRQVIFMIDSLQDHEKLNFVQGTFALNGIDINKETVLWKLRELNDEKYISVGCTMVGVEEKKDYFLTPKGATIGEEIFVRQKILASASILSSPITVREDTPVAIDKVSAKTLNIPTQKIDIDKVVRGIFDRYPETKTFSSSRLLRYLKDFAREQGIEITITEGRIRQLPVWKENSIHRKSGTTQYREEMGDALDKNAEDVNDSDYEMADS